VFLNFKNIIPIYIRFITRCTNFSKNNFGWLRKAQDAVDLWTVPDGAVISAGNIRQVQIMS
jgi:hypothetical protein